MFNRVRLIKGHLNLTEKEFKKFKPGDSLWGDSSDPEALMEWSMEKVEEAKEELKKYKCTYKNIHYIYEYALEYYMANDDNEYAMGSDYDLAEREEMEDDVE